MKLWDLTSRIAPVVFASLHCLTVAELASGASLPLPSISHLLTPAQLQSMLQTQKAHACLCEGQAFTEVRKS